MGDMTVRVDLPLSEAECAAVCDAATEAGLSIDDWMARLVRRNLSPMPECARGEKVAITFLQDNGGVAPAAAVLDALEAEGLTRRNARRVQAVSKRITCDGPGSTTWKLVSP